MRRAPTKRCRKERRLGRIEVMVKLEISVDHKSGKQEGEIDNGYKEKFFCRLIAVGRN